MLTAAKFMIRTALLDFAGREHLLMLRAMSCSKRMLGSRLCSVSTPCWVMLTGPPHPLRCLSRIMPCKGHAELTFASTASAARAAAASQKGNNTSMHAICNDRCDSFAAVALQLPAVSRRKVYDQTGSLSDTEELSGEAFDDLYSYYRTLFPKVTTEDIEKVAPSPSSSAIQRQSDSIAY